MKLWSWKEENLRRQCTRLDYGCGDPVAVRAQLIGILGGDCQPRGDAIDLRCDAHNIRRTHRRQRLGRFARSNRIHLLWLKPDCICARDISSRNPVLRVAFARDQLLMCERHFEDHRAHSTHRRTGAPWSIAAHRFKEVSIRIVVALVVVASWEERRRLTIGG